MMELEPGNRRNHMEETVVAHDAIHRDGEPTRGLMFAVSSDFAAPAQSEGTDMPNTALAALVRHRLELHPQFRGRTSLFTVEQLGESIVIKGCVPSYYLKQLLQEATKAMPGVGNIDNQVHVMWPNSQSTP